VSSFSFHHKYALNRERLSRMLRCVAEEQATSNDAIGAFVSVNPYVVRSLRGWFRHTGLGDYHVGRYTLSPFGNLAAQYDALLEQPGTFWLMHYNRVSEQSLRAEN